VVCQACDDWVTTCVGRDGAEVELSVRGYRLGFIWATSWCLLLHPAHSSLESMAVGSAAFVTPALELDCIPITSVGEEDPGAALVRTLFLAGATDQSHDVARLVLVV